MPLGQFFIRTAYRRTLTGVLEGPAPGALERPARVMIPPVTGYLDRLSRRPGEPLHRACIGFANAGPCRARIVRVVSADPNPAGRAWTSARCRRLLDDHAFEGTHQPVRARVLRARAWRAALRPRRRRGLGGAGLAAAGVPAATVLAVEGGGASLVLRAGAGGAEVEVTVGGDVCGSPLARSSPRWRGIASGCRTNLPPAACCSARCRSMVEARCAEGQLCRPADVPG